MRGSFIHPLIVRSSFFVIFISLLLKVLFVQQMDAQTALRRAAARAVTQPDFDPTGIPNVESLIEELKQHCPEFFDKDSKYDSCFQR